MRSCGRARATRRSRDGCSTRRHERDATTRRLTVRAASLACGARISPQILVDIYVNNRDPFRCARRVWAQQAAMG
jgi:hypothetical protein